MSKKDKLVPYLKADKIRSLIAELGKRISGDYAKILKPDEDVLVIVTLKGAAFFAADLVREISVPIRMDFVRVASYGAGTKTSGTVRILKDIESPVEGTHVLILDEIVESGRTLKFLIERMLASHPKSLKVCSLLSKPSRREVEVDIDYLGAEIDDKFLVGYGLDYAEKYRNLPEVYYIEN